MQSAILPHIIFLSIWLPLMGSTVYSLFAKKYGNQNQGEPIAKLEAVVGDVQFRPDAEVFWQGVEPKQYVFEDDNVATGENSFVSVNFANSRLLELGPNTQIRIRNTGTNGKDLDLELVRGELAARSLDGKGDALLGKNGGKLNIAIGKTNYSLGQDGEIVLDKERGSANHGLLMVNGQVRRMDRDDNKVQRLSAFGSKVNLAANPGDDLVLRKPEVKPVKKPVMLAAAPAKILAPPPPGKAIMLAKPPEIDGKQFLGRIAFPGSNILLAKRAPIEELRTSESIPVVLEPPQEQPKDTAEWKPSVKLTGVADATSIIGLEPVLQRQISDMKLQDVMSKKIASIQKDGLLDLYQFKALPMVSLRDTPTQSFRDVFGAPQTVTFTSTSVAVKNKVKVSLGQFGIKNVKDNWAALPREFTPAVTILVTRQNDYDALWPFICGSKGFKVEDTSEELTGSGVFAVRDQLVVSKLQGLITSGKELDMLRKGFQAEAIFEGKASAYIGGLKQFKERLEAKTLPEKIYILHQGRYIGVNRDFMKTNPTLRAYLNENTSAFFSEPVEILSAENYIKK